MANQQAIDKILNKQFKKTAFAGYDPEDVDTFFDLVIDYLKANNKAVDEFKVHIDKLIKNNQDLSKEVSRLNQELSLKNKLIIRYEQEGYGNVLANKRITSLEETVKELKKEKQNAK